ncbi:MAG: hypothetical protein WC297_02080 [Candidatus Paceibacterota bacterium]|jgi:hypothetical protein
MEFSKFPNQRWKEYFIFDQIFSMLIQSPNIIVIAKNPNASWINPNAISFNIFSIIFSEMVSRSADNDKGPVRKAARTFPHLCDSF